MKTRQEIVHHVQALLKSEWLRARVADSSYRIEDAAERVVKSLEEVLVFDEQVYCPVCTSCGEEGCCSPIHCQQHAKGFYCEGAMRDLKWGYQMFKDTSNLIPQDAETQKKYDEAFEENWNLIYKRDENS